MIRHFIIAIIMIWGLSACVATRTLQTTNDYEKVSGVKTILLLEPDVQISFIKASEVREPRADWTDLAEANLIAAMRARLAKVEAEIITFETDTASEHETQLIKLHEAVGSTIIFHRFATQPLPSKKGKFDWTLGPGVRTLAENNDADFALLIFARGEYASAGKVMANIILGAAFGATGSMGGQQAFASLIDLRNGDIIWFNVATTGTGMDMREPEGAAKVVESLLKDIPL